MMTLGSLFDGSGGFPLGGLLAGITPVWASEIEPFPIRVTTKRLPFMKHYGDISTLDGGKIEPVDIITFGSPCQDMSVAGRRDGLDGSRSSLFYEAIRIIKEMRYATNGKYPRYIVWENVPGAFSSNGGEDFKAVLEAVIGVVCEGTEVPMPEKNRWPYADLYMGDGWSLAYRTLDAQYWGVPQRRRRIYLVADFAGGSAGEILFESEGLSGYSAEGFRSWQRTAGSAADRTGTASLCLNDQGGQRMDVTYDVTATFHAEAHHPPCVLEETVALENHPMDGRVKLEENGKVQTLSERMGTGGNNVPLVLKIRSGCEGGGKGPLIQTDKSATLSCNNDQTLFEPCSWDGGQISPTLTKQNAGGGQRMPDKDNFNCVLQPVTGPLLASGYEKIGTQEAANGMYVIQPFGICSKDSNAMKSSNPHSGIYEADTSRTIDTSGGNPACNQGGMAVVAFAQNQRDEVRDLGTKAGCISAEPGMKQQTYVLQGDMIGRSEGNGPQGDGINEDVSFTLNTVDRHAVYAMTTGSFTQVAEDKAPMVLARDYKDPTAVCYGIGRDTFNQGKNAKFAPTFEEELQPTLVAKGPGAIQSGYTVRRLTPTECARLQGFPDWWCDDLGIEPTTDDLRYWCDVFETHRRIVGGSSKPKSLKQITKWLRDPHSDAAEYKMWGNGVALPCVWFVLCGIVWANG